MLILVKKIECLMKIFREGRKLLVTLYWFLYITYYRIRKIICKDIVFCECYIMHNGYGVKKNNWGDDLNKFFMEYLTSKKFIFIPYDQTFFKKDIHYSLIGSIIGFYKLQNTIIYGSGIIRPSIDIKGEPKNIVSVRGPRTRAELLKRGIQCPENYGDPAMLLPLFYKPKKIEGKMIGAIPNMGSFGNENMNKLIQENKWKLINLVDYDEWTDIIDQITNCEFIISESLHGLIVAETYGIPSVWVEFIEHDVEWEFKYRDFYESIGKENMSSLKLYQDFNMKELFKYKDSWKKGNIDYKELLSSFPFEIKCKINTEVLGGDINGK